MLAWLLFVLCCAFLLLCCSHVSFSFFPCTALFRSLRRRRGRGRAGAGRGRRLPRLRARRRRRRARSRGRDRKSTRLNSSHLGISYAVFCLKKKKTNNKAKKNETQIECITSTCKTTI